MLRVSITNGNDFYLQIMNYCFEKKKYIITLKFSPLSMVIDGCVHFFSFENKSHIEC